MHSFRRPPRDYKARDARRREERNELERLCRQHDLPLPWGPYRAAPHTCYRCRQRTVVYTWVHHGPRGHDWPPSPRPAVLQLRRTRQPGGVRYWTNECVSCHATQGDHYLYVRGTRSDPPPFRFTWARGVPQIPGDPSEQDALADASAGDAFVAGRMVSALLGGDDVGW